MTVSSTTRQAGPYDGNGVTTAFPFAFRVFSAGDVQVVQTDPDGVETTLTLTTHYTVSLNANQNSNAGGTVTAVSAPATGYKWTLTSDIDPLQAIDLTNLGGFYPAVINTGFDKLTILVQQVLNKVARSIKIPISDNSGEITIPTAAGRANRFLAFDGDGNPIAATGLASSPVSAFMAPVVAAATAPAARALLGFDSSSGGDFLVFQNTAAAAEAALRLNATQATSGISLKLSNSALNKQVSMRAGADGGLSIYVNQTAGGSSTSGVQSLDCGPDGNVVVGNSPAVNTGRTLTVFNNDAGAGAYARMQAQSNAGTAFLQVQSIAGGRGVSLYCNTGGALNVFTQDAQALNLGTNNNATRMVFGATSGITVNENMTFASGVTPIAKNTAKAWVNFNGTGTVAIRDSHNVDSITDHGTGDYTINFTAGVLANANYATAMSANSNTGTQARWAFENFDNVVRTTTQLRIYTLTGGLSQADTAVVCVTVFGA